MKNWQEYLTQDNQLLLQESLLNCHTFGLHSLILDKDDSGFYTRMFITDKFHDLWKNQCGIVRKKWDDLSIAIHPHHCDIEIEPIHGIFWNIEFSHKQRKGVEKDQRKFKMFQYKSEILDGKGGFEYLEDQLLVMRNQRFIPVGRKHEMKSDEMHTVYISQKQICAWIIREKEASTAPNSVCYSNHDLTEWTSEGLYQKPSLEQINEILKPLQIEI